MKKICYTLLLTFFSVCSYASSDSIYDDGRTIIDVILDKIEFIFIAIMAIYFLPALLAIAKDWLSGGMGNDSDSNSLGCMSIVTIAAIILFFIIECS